MTFHEFKFYLGETIMFCQIIESDLKIIYVNLLGKEKELIWNQIEKVTLGSMVKNLQQLDNKCQLLSSDDYYYLHLIAGKRNHWCHKTFINFLYTGENFRESKQFIDESNKLKSDHDQLEKIYRILEQIRINLIRKNRKEN